MASFFKNLSGLIVLTIITQVFTSGQLLTEDDFVQEQEDQDDSSSDKSYFRDFLNAFINRWKHEKEIASSVDEYSDSEGDLSENEDERQMRNLPMDLPGHLCEMTTREIVFSEAGHVYMPSFYHEVTCTRMPNKHHSHLDLKNKKYCYSDKPCITEIQELAIFRRQNGSTCWKPDPRKVSVGCLCRFPSHHLPHLTPHKMDF